MTSYLRTNAVLCWYTYKIATLQIIFLVNAHEIHPSRNSYNAFSTYCPDSKVHGANMGPNWVLSAPDGPHVGPHEPCYQGGPLVPQYPYTNPVPHSLGQLMMRPSNVQFIMAKQLFCGYYRSNIELDIDYNHHWTFKDDYILNHI